MSLIQIQHAGKESQQLCALLHVKISFLLKSEERDDTEVRSASGWVEN